jgi:hypothetical protein
MSRKYVFVVPKAIEDQVYAEPFKEITSGGDHQRVEQFAVGLDLIAPLGLHMDKDPGS